MGWLVGWLVIVLIGFVLWYFREARRIEDLPRGARKYKGPFNNVLQRAYEERLKFLRETDKVIFMTAGMFKDFGAFSSSEIWWDPEKEQPSERSKKFFNGKAWPQVEGTSWWDCICIPVKKGFVLLYEPWVTESPPRPNIIYTLGAVTQEELERVFNTFSDNFAKLITEPQ